MQIEQIAIRLRRRTPREAIDLGGAMLRAWAPGTYRIWMFTYWPVGLLLLAIFWHHQTIAMAILWWLKPAFDRILLFAYSRSLFHQPTSLRDVLRALPGLARQSGLWSGLSLRRLSLARSLLLPVWQLEGLRGAAARQRFKLLARRTRGTAAWLTVVCSNLSTALCLSFILLIEVMRPQGSIEFFQFSDWFSNDLTPDQEILGSLLYLLAETLIEPLYMASGFALYLNRRSELEGWDIELAFRRLAGRLATAAAGLLLAVGLAGVSLSPATAWAEPGAARPEVKAEVTAESREKQTINGVLADPVFGHRDKELEWQWRKSDEAKPAGGLPDWLRNLRAMLEFASQVMSGLAWILGFLLLAFFIYLLVIYRERWLPRDGRRAAPPDFLFGLDVRPESLPADLIGAARAALAAGRVEAALSLLYRGALVALIQRTPVEFRAGDTEDNCRQRIAGHVEAPASSYFAELLEAWRATAYARQPPPPAALEALCAGWEAHFGQAFGVPAK
ncbi:MAG: DUF4129 domain-containing protein [Azonexus sp.]